MSQAFFNALDKLHAKEQLPSLEPEMITGVCGRLLDEVDMPEDIRQEVEELYQIAVQHI